MLDYVEWLQNKLEYSTRVYIILRVCKLQHKHAACYKSYSLGNGDYALSNWKMPNLDWKTSCVMYCSTKSYIELARSIMHA